MSLPVPTVAELSTFTGRAVPSFSAFASQALAQSTLLFSVITKLTVYPTDADQAQLAKNAILELADRILLEQPYQSIRTGPFQSETIGSYSYSKSTQTVRTAQQGMRTGLFWWDLAIDELSLPGSSVLSHGSVWVEPEGLSYTEGEGWRLDSPVDDEQPPYIRIS